VHAFGHLRGRAPRLGHQVLRFFLHRGSAGPPVAAGGRPGSVEYVPLSAFRWALRQAADYREGPVPVRRNGRGLHNRQPHLKLIAVLVACAGFPLPFCHRGVWILLLGGHPIVEGG